MHSKTSSHEETALISYSKSLSAVPTECRGLHEMFEMAGPHLRKAKRAFPLGADGQRLPRPVLIRNSCMLQKAPWRMTKTERGPGAPPTVCFSSDSVGWLRRRASGTLPQSGASVSAMLILDKLTLLRSQP